MGCFWTATAVARWGTLSPPSKGPGSRIHRSASEAGSSHVSIIFAAPFTPTAETKSAYQRVIRYLQSAFSALAGVVFDHTQAGRLLPLTFAYTKCPDLPGVVVETVAKEGAALDVVNFLTALGFDDTQPEPVPVRARTTSTDRTMSRDEVRALLTAAAVSTNLVVPPTDVHYSYSEKLSDSWKLVRRTLELAGSRASEVDRDDLQDVAEEHFGDRKHVPEVVASAIDKAFASGKPDIVARDARLLDAIRLRGAESATAISASATGLGRIGWGSRRAAR